MSVGDVICRVLEHAGPTGVKLGQAISVRPDLVGPDIAEPLERLRDSAAPLPCAVVRATIEREFGRSVEALFDDFADTPIASASIAQVHRARLRESYRPVFGARLPAGTPVAVKVVRPGIARRIARDSATLRRIARVAGGIPGLARFGPHDLLAEFEASIAREIDLRNEAHVATRFAFDFREDSRLVVPRVVWPLTSRSVLTTEFIEGWRLSELGAADRAGIDARGLALHGATLFLRQVLEVGRFHADLHPSNLFVTPDSRICYLDFGITGTTTPAEQTAIARLLGATIHRDAAAAVEASRALGIAVPTAQEAAFVADVQRLLASTIPTGGEPSDIRAYAFGFLRLLRRYRITVPRGYGMLVKALVTIEGVSRMLYPDIDIVRTSAPLVTELLAGRSFIRSEDLVHAAGSVAVQVERHVRESGLLHTL